MASTVIPGLSYRDAKAAMRWLEDVLGFRTQVMIEGPGGSVAHAQMTFGDGMVMLGSAGKDGGAAGLVRHPDEVGGVETQAPYLVVQDAAAVYARARAAGAAIVQELEEKPYGGKAFSCRDPEGHLWFVGEYDPWIPQSEAGAPPQPVDAAKLNPYASFRDGRAPLPVLEATAAKLEAIACGMTPEQLETPRAEGKWSPKEVLAHLADCEISFGFRLRQTLAGLADGSAVTIQPFDQGTWAERYGAYDVPGALATFSALRGWNLRLIGTVTEADKARKTVHPERGPMNFWTIVETMAGHDVNHLRQLGAD
jgi:uncharacterized glyoxalase superfamily protein PhnB